MFKILKEVLTIQKKEWKPQTITSEKKKKNKDEYRQSKIWGLDNGYIYISTIYKICRYINIYIYIDMKSIKQISINKIIVLILAILLFNESYNQGNLNIKLKRDN